MKEFSLKNLEIKMPTKEELYESGIKEYLVSRVTDMNYWYPRYQHLTQKSTSIDLTIDECLTLVNDASKVEEKHPTLLPRLKKHLDTYDNPVFVRGNFRSPKDYAFDNELGMCIFDNVDDIFDAMVCSLRMLTDYCLFMRVNEIPEKENYGAKPSIYFREVIPDFNKGNEFRAYVKSGQLLALSRYYEGTTSNVDLDKALDAMHEVIDEISENEPDVVIDLYCHSDTEISLIELNPYGLSDPLLYKDYKTIESFTETNYKL